MVSLYAWASFDEQRMMFRLPSAHVIFGHCEQHHDVESPRGLIVRRRLLKIMPHINRAVAQREYAVESGQHGDILAASYSGNALLKWRNEVIMTLIYYSRETISATSEKRRSLNFGGIGHARWRSRFSWWRPLAKVRDLYRAPHRRRAHTHLGASLFLRSAL